MNTEKILFNLSDKFGIRLNIREEKLPDKVKIVINPQDFEPRKGFSVISEIKWLNLKTYLQFDNFSGDLLSAIMRQHKDRVDVMIDTILMMTKNPQSAILSAEIEGVKITDSNIPVDIRKLSLHIESQPIKLGTKSIEDYIIEHQVIILGLILLLFDLEENYSNDYDVIEYVAEGESEGSKTRIEISKYERSRVNRQVCLNYYGYSCKICGFNFESVYGKIGKAFIHVHHILPVSMLGEGYIVNPIKDLIPVCPNCHSMLHRSNPPLTIAELVKVIKT